jgi:proteasome lid subunit RPN8/RPN11
MVLLMPERLMAAMKQAAVLAYPLEGCGLMLGRRLVQAASRDGAEDDRQVVDLAMADNRWDHSVQDLTDPLEKGENSPCSGLDRHRRYWIDPEMMLTVQKEARSRHLDIIGVYHSHPEHPAIPSECDRRMAWPVYSYVIISVKAGRAVDWRSWQLDDQHQFRAEAIKIVDKVSP